jgi:hypothetical protein
MSESPVKESRIPPWAILVIILGIVSVWAVLSNKAAIAEWFIKPPATLKQP